MTPETGRRTQAERRARSRGSLLEAAARGIARHGYAQLSLESVAREAGYTRGALYHQFAGKEQLALAVVGWVDDTWDAEVGVVLDEDSDPAETLVALARAHIVFCRRDVGAVLRALRVEFDSRDHAVGRALDDSLTELSARCARLIRAGRRTGAIPPGPPVALTASAFIAAIETVGIAVAGRRPHDTTLAERTALGILGLPPV